MTSRQLDGWTAPVRTAVLPVIAAILAGNAGCAQLQKGWIDRFGPDRAALASRPAPVAPEGGPHADPYAARVALNDRPAPRAWVPLPEGVSPPPPPGTAPAPVQTPPVAPPAWAAPPSSSTAAAVPPVAPPSTVEEPPTTASEPAGPVSRLDAIEALVDRGIARLDATRNYRVTLDRQEQVRGSLLPAETVALSVRREPFAVRLEWPEGPNRGREVLFSEAECEGMMHVKLGKTLIPMPPMRLEPNSPLALSNSRHPITEAGLRHILTQIKDQLASARAGDAAIGQFTLNGPLVPPELEASCHEILRETPEGDHWRLLLDEETSLPLLLEATAGDGQLLERYRFRDIQADLAELDGPDAFNPDVRFGRIASRSNDPGDGSAAQ